MKKALSIVAILFAVSILATSCDKEHQCKCTTTDGTDDNLLKIIFADRGLDCESITEMAEEQKVVVDGTQTLTRSEIHTVSCRDYAE